MKIQQLRNDKRYDVFTSLLVSSCKSRRDKRSENLLRNLRSVELLDEVSSSVGRSWVVILATLIVSDNSDCDPLISPTTTAGCRFAIFSL